MTKTTSTASKKDAPDVIKYQHRATEYYGLQPVFDKLYDQSKRGHVFKDLMSYITAPNNIMLAYRNLKANSGSKTAGVDKKTIENLKHIPTEDLIRMVQNKLRNYTPRAVRRVEIPKGDGKTRPLGIPTIEDRLVQQCIKQVLDPICEAKFFEHSYGFRPERTCEHAISYFQKLAQRDKKHFVVDVDIKGFFDNVSHEKLMKQLWTLGIRDKNLLCVIGKCLKAPIDINGDITYPTKGTPQGGILSPLLSNIVLNELDWWVADQWYHKKMRMTDQNKSNRYKALRNKSRLKEGHLVRYADDFKIMCTSKADAVKWYHAVKNWLKERLDLDISDNKSKITNLRKFNSEFLGFRFKLRAKEGKWVMKSHMTKKAKDKMVSDIKEQLNKLYKGKDVDLLNTKILGRQRYYQIATHINIDMSEINYLLSKSIWNKTSRYRKAILRSCKRSKTEYKEYIKSLNIINQETYDKFYKTYNYKRIVVMNRLLFPIGAVTTRHALGFTQAKTPYTEEGRKLIHKNLECVSEEDLAYVRNNPIPNMSAQYNDNRISVLTKQWGKCEITGEPLDVRDMHCHHVIPRSKGCKDDFRNLIIVTPVAHRVIHGTDRIKLKENFSKLWIRDWKHRESILRKLNKYRKLVGNETVNL